MSLPSDDPLIIGSPDDIIWGTAGVYSGATITMSAQNERTGGKREIKDNNGNTVIVVYFDNKNQCEVVCLGESSLTLPDRGDTVTIAGIACACDTVTTNWKNEQEQSFTVKATAYDQIALS